jgi:hypothetical protein
MGGSDKVRQTREKVVLQERIYGKQHYNNDHMARMASAMVGASTTAFQSASKLMPRIVHLVQHKALLEEGVGQALSGLLDHL